jgi:phosphoribosylglycinamide formyltransferase-1
MSQPKIVVCASGEGSNFEAIVAASRRGELRAEITGLIVNRPKIGALGRARRLGIREKVLSPSKFSSRDAWDQAMLAQLEEWGADWLVLAGYLVLIGPQVLARFPGKIVNSHPSLLPKFGGPGMYGERVHHAVLAAGEKETGITFHLVDAHYDQGFILHQCKIPIHAGETVEQLSARLKREENYLFPKILNDLIHIRS